MRKLNKNNGITLIALVITIIVMLILVSVSISMAVNGGLFNYAGKAVGDTKNAIDKEKELSKGRIKIGDTWYDSIDDYLKNKPSANQDSNDGGLKITSQVISNGKDVDIDLTFSGEYMSNYIDKNFYTDKEETELEKMLENLTAGTDNEITFTDELRAAVKAEVESMGISYKAYLKLYLVELGEDTQKIQQIQDAMKISVTVSNGDTFEVSIGDKYSYLVLESGIYTFEAVTGEGIKATHTVEVKGDFETFSAPYTTTEKNNYKDEEGNYATIPAGFSVGTSDTISKISTGLVIRDANGNEFVWIPVTEDLANPYTISGYSEPTVLTYTYTSSGAAYDSQKTLDYLYGENYYNYAKDFNYADEYEKMVDRVNFYDGFYIGRYETTIDERGNIGSKNNTEVLTAGTTLFTKTNEEGETVNYPYMWYGLYYAQKNANVTGNEKNGWVQTAMIYGQLWDKAMAYIKTQKTAGKTNYNVDSDTYAWHTGRVVNSGQANKTTVGVNGAIGDVALNIWDLEANADEWTQESCNALGRSLRGGDIYTRYCASHRGHYMMMNGASTTVSSRLALYIK